MSDDSKLLEEILNNSTTRTYAEYASDDFGVEKQQIDIGRALEKQVLEKFAPQIVEQGYTFRSVSEEKLKQAREQLFGGKVAGVDGRRDKPIDIVSGVFCEVGIAAVTYQTLSKPELGSVPANGASLFKAHESPCFQAFQQARIALHQIEGHYPELSCRSITSHLKESTTAEEYYQNLKSNRLRERTITSAMICWELETCLNLDVEWILKDGPILHPDLVWRGYPFLLELLKKIINHKKIMGVVKDLRGEKSIPLRRLGKLLRPGQFLVIYRGVSGWIEPVRLTETAKRFLRFNWLAFSSTKQKARTSVGLSCLLVSLPTYPTCLCRSHCRSSRAWAAAHRSS